MGSHSLMQRFDSGYSRKRKPVPDLPPFIQCGGSSGKQETAAGLHKLPDSPALRIGHRSKIRQNDEIQLFGVSGYMIGMDRHERNSCTGQRPYKTMPWERDLFLRIVAPVKVRIYLAPYKTDIRHRISVIQESFVLFMPLHDRRRIAKLPFVFLNCADVVTREKFPRRSLPTSITGFRSEDCSLGERCGLRECSWPYFRE